MTTTASSTSSAPTATGKLAGMGTADALALSARMGWMPSYPTFNRNPLDLADEVEASGQSVGDYVVDQLQSRRARVRVRGPGRARRTGPRVLTMWRANLFGSSGKGNEYFLKHLLGTDISVRADETPEHRRPRDIVWHDEAPEGKLDLLCTLDFRMTSSTILSDIVLPAATWYEKHDISTTDMHPFIHSFNPAIAPPWQTKTDWDIFQVLAEDVRGTPAKEHLGVRRDLVAVPLLHDTAEAMATPHGIVKDWKKGECEPVPGTTMPKLVVVERDYGAVAEKMVALGPLMEKLGATTKGITYDVSGEIDYLPREERSRSGEGWPTAGRAWRTDIAAAETIMALSGHHQRTPRYSGLPDARAADRHDRCTTSPPSTRGRRSPSPTPRRRLCR